IDAGNGANAASVFVTDQNAGNVVIQNNGSFSNEAGNTGTYSVTTTAVPNANSLQTASGVNISAHNITLTTQNTGQINLAGNLTSTADSSGNGGAITLTTPGKALTTANITDNASSSGT